MNAEELFLHDGRKAGIWYCQCKHVYNTQAEAEQCCKPRLCECGAVCAGYYTACDPCMKRRAAEQEQAAFDAAEKVTQWDGPVYLDGFGRDGFCDDLGVLLDEIADLDEGAVRPVYCWACDTEPFPGISVDSAIECMEDEMFEDAHDRVVSVSILEDANARFIEANQDLVTFRANYKRVVLLAGHYEALTP